jgi:hypothetical protein
LHFSHSARILIIKLKSDLNPKYFTVIVVSCVLNDQERRYKYGYSGSGNNSDAGTPSVSSVPGNRPCEQNNSDR